MPPTPPSSHGSDTEGSQSPVHPCVPATSTQTPAVLKVALRAPTTLSTSPLLTSPHVSMRQDCSAGMLLFMTYFPKFSYNVFPLVLSLSQTIYLTFF